MLDPASVDAELESIKVNIDLLWAELRDHAKRFDTLQTPLWKRLWFRIDGWPGQRDLNGRRRWRPWHFLALVAVLVASLSPGRVDAAPNQSTGIAVTLENYNGIATIRGCMSEDSQLLWAAAGSLAPGESFSFTPRMKDCNNRRAVSASLSAFGGKKGADLEFSVSHPVLGGTTVTDGLVKRICLFPAVPSDEEQGYTFTVTNRGARTVSSINVGGQDRNDWPIAFWTQCQDADFDHDGWSDAFEHSMHRLNGYQAGNTVWTVEDKLLVSGSNYLSGTATPAPFDELDPVPSDLNDDGLHDQSDRDLLAPHVGEGNGVAMGSIQVGDTDEQNFKWRRYDLNGDGWVDALDLALAGVP